ncbi:unnamed protein product [Caenorhabditis auriculariae]|uniref:FYVE-type domain-containing protein n=1 Tax=Caenorhabditis auriculariae TaxID=2777116 RepID=A0A8S1GV45_9PELO|nr:unnamed protein product [Caenorhabditis auriculariae]
MRLQRMRLFSWMPSSQCCSNCGSKYSLLNREAGCSSCAFSFCKKCLDHRTVIPNLSPHPVTVCYNCYKKIEAKKLKTEAVITSVPLPGENGTSASTSGQKNWWGEGLPPPSMRQQYGAFPPTSQNRLPNQNHFSKVTPQDEQIRQLEARRAQLRADEPKAESQLSTDDIERRLAMLRGCDIELVRNPKAWFEAHPKQANETNSVAGLMKMAEDRAAIEESLEENERKELDELERRHRMLKKKAETEKDDKEEDDVSRNESMRMSMTSGTSEYSTATKEQLESINELMRDAEKRVQESKAEEEASAQDVRKILASTRQKSLDAMKMNEKVNNEFGQFWDRQLDKTAKGLDTDSEEDELDEETMRRILKEAEETPEEPIAVKKIVQSDQAVPSSDGSPKKKGGFFSKFFGNKT